MVRQTNKISTHLSTKNLIFLGVAATLVIAAIILFTINYSVSSTEICGNGIDDDWDGSVDEAGCTCMSGSPIVISGSSTTYYGVSQSNSSVFNANNVLGASDDQTATLNSNSDLLFIELGHTLSTGDEYTVRWEPTSSYSSATLEVYETSDGHTYYLNRRITLSSSTLVNTVLQANRNTRDLLLATDTGASIEIDNVSYTIGTATYGCSGSIELCGNRTDDDLDGQTDESDCFCSNGSPTLLTTIESGFAVAQGNVSVNNAENAVGEAGSDYAEIYENNDVLILKLQEEIPAGENYTIYWSSQEGDLAEMMVSESSDSATFYFNASPSTTAITAEKVTLTAGVNTRYLRFDKRDITSVSGITVNNAINTGNPEDYRVYGITYSFNQSSYTCDNDWDGDGIEDSVDLDDDNDGIPDLIEQLGFDTNNCTKTAMRFVNPSLESGSSLSQGATYRFSNILSGIDGLVEITTLSNVYINNLDYTISGYNDAFQPTLGFHSGLPSGYALYTIRFVRENTTQDTLLGSVGGAALDIDGSSGTAIEGFSTSGFDYIATDDITELTHTSAGSIDNFRGPSITYDGISTTDPQVMVFFNDRYTSTILYYTYVFNTSAHTERLFSIYLDQCLANNFTNLSPITENFIDTDGDGVADYRDLDSDNDGIYDVVESGANVASTAGVVDGNVTTSGIPVAVDADNDQTIDFVVGDADGNGNLNFVTLDSDGDGISDIAEAGFTDADNDGQLDGTGFDDRGLIITSSEAYMDPGTGYTDDESSGEYSGVLPVEWLAFEAELMQDGTQLYWATGSEINSDFYAVERSYDKHLYQSIGSVEAAGNANTPTEYQFIDKTLNHGSVTQVFYRLKQVDIDGSIDYSQVYTLNVSGQASVEKMEMYPNPATDKVHLDIIAAPDLFVEIQIYTVSGQLHDMLKGKAGTYEIEVSHWPKGVYLIRVDGLAAPLVEKLVVE